MSTIVVEDNVATVVEVDVENVVVVTETDLQTVEIGILGPQGPPGPAGPSGINSAFTYEQVLAATTWNIPHNLGFNPAVTTVDSAGTVVEGEVLYIDVNNVRVLFSAPFSGKAYLS